jgi:ABC-2 type transport system permease protein
MIPATHFLRLTRKVMLKGATVADTAGDMIWIAGLMLLISALAVRRYRQTLD